MKYRLSDFADINPRESIKKGSVAKKIAMDKLQPFCRDVPSCDYEVFSGGSKFRNGDTIMARITPCLENGKTAKVNILDENEVGFGSTEYIVFRSKPGISDEDYLYYLICSPLVREPAIKSMVGSSGRQRVQTDVVQNLVIDVPSIAEQKRIGALLKALDDKIAVNNEINKNLYEQVFALYDQIFSNPEPRICRADEYFDISIGKTPPRKEPEWFSESSSNTRWVSISDMGNCGLYISDSSEYLVPEAVSKFNVVIVPDNTVLLSFKLTVGRVAITDGETTTNEAIAHFKTDHKDINPYLYCYLKRFNYQSLGSTSSIATAINSKIVKAMPFVIPNNTDLKRFNELALPAFEMVKSNLSENKRLSSLRDSLLPKLMSGELDVSELDL